MKKITAKIIAAIMAILMLASFAGCGLLEQISYDVDGLSITLPVGMYEIEAVDFNKVLTDNNITVYFYRDTFEELAEVELDQISIEEFAELYAMVNEIPNPYTADANGNLITTYNVYFEGTNLYNFDTVRKSSDSFWNISFTCADSDKDKYADKFVEWANTIVVD